MTLKLTQDEASLLIACLTALEQELRPGEPMSRALDDLRPMRSRLMEAWLRAGLNMPPAEDGSL